MANEITLTTENGKRISFSADIIAKLHYGQRVEVYDRSLDLLYVATYEAPFVLFSDFNGTEYRLLKDSRCDVWSLAMRTWVTLAFGK